MTLLLRETVRDEQKATLGDKKHGTMFRFADTSSIFIEASADAPNLYLIIGKASTDETYVLPLDAKGGILKRKDTRRIISYPGEIRPKQPQMKKIHLRDAVLGTIVRLAPENDKPLVSVEELVDMEKAPAYIVIGEARNNRVPIVQINLDQKDTWVESPEMDDDMMVIPYNMEVTIPMQAC